ncbi:zinc ribbon domain-containing protein [Prevotella sp. HUN102]|uniref:zinc ribbon domain-containing protein n=1 Tax=Prevotella sp. HUN102 TaxID=1392486 RepID=UPI000491CDA7|nr:zinc ribbon domain-containing protein [Prevotella sp. HUN102]
MIIKCPECGHQISDKAPLCPHCGVEIAGHLVKCSNCGETYLNVETSCPNCHYSELTGSENIAEDRLENTEKADESSAEAIVMDNESSADASLAEADTTVVEAAAMHGAEVAADVSETDDEVLQAVELEEVVESEKEKEIFVDAEVDDDAEISDATSEETKKNNHIALLVSLLLAVLIGVIFLFFYNKGLLADQAADEYSVALKSNDVELILKYLKEHPNASAEQKETLQNAIATLTQGDDELSKVEAQNTIEAYRAYLAKNPDSDKKNEILDKMDEIAWANATAEDTEKSYLDYCLFVEQQKYGKHKAEAEEKLKDMAEASLPAEASSEDKSKAVSAVRNFLVGINSRSADKIKAEVAETFSFKGAAGATAKNVMDYIRIDLYKADVSQAIWNLNKESANVTVEKKEDGSSALKISINGFIAYSKKDGTSPKVNKTINATLQNGKITSISW